MPPVVSAVGTFFATLAAKGVVAALFATAVGKAIMYTAFSVGVNLLFSRKPGVTSFEQGIQTRLQVASNVTRKAIYGRAKTGGSLVFVDEAGADNADLYMVIALADHKCEGLAGLYVNGRAVTLNSGVVSEYTSGGVDHMTYTFYDGGSTQTFNTALATATAWTNAHHLKGVCYVIVKMIWDADLFTTGIPNLEWIVDGRLVYDPRADSTVTGGSGAHREADESTWEFSANPALCLRDYLRGVTMTDASVSPAVSQRVLGMGVASAKVPVADVMAAATICDESVSLKAGGSETRYECGVVIDSGDAHRENIRLITSAMAGAVHDQAGELSIVAGAANTSILTVTDDDIVWTQDFSFEPKRGRDEIVNAVSGRYVDPDQQYSDVEYPTRADTADETADGGQRWKTDLDLLAVQSNTQAQRIAEIFRRSARLQGKLHFTAGPRLLELEAGDWFTFSSARYGWTSPTKAFRVETITHNGDLSVSITAQEVASTIYDWTPASDEITPAGQDTPTVPALGDSYAGKYIETGQIADNAVTDAKVASAAAIVPSKIFRPADTATLGSDTAFTSTSWANIVSVALTNVPTDPAILINGTALNFEFTSDAADSAATVADWRIIEDDGASTATIVEKTGGLTFINGTSFVEPDTTNELSPDYFTNVLFGATLSGSVTYRLQAKITTGSQMNIDTTTVLGVRAL